MSPSDFAQLGPVAEQGEPSQLELKVARIFERSCLSCHQPGQVRKGFQLLDAEGGFVGTKQFRKMVYESVASGSMPKGKSLDPNDVKTLHDWMNEIE